MNEKFNKNAKDEQLTKMFLSHGEEKGLIVKDPLLEMHWNNVKHILTNDCCQQKQSDNF